MSTLSVALDAAVSSLNAVQQGISVASNNLANVSTPGYVRQATTQVPVISGGIGQGVAITGIVSDVDAQLLKSIQVQTSALGKSGSIQEYLDSAQRLFGQPTADNSLNSRLDAFYSTMQALSNSPETTSLRLAAVNAAQGLATTISNISRGLQQLRLDADREISGVVNAINSLIVDLGNSNGEIIGFPEGSSGRLGIEQQRELNLRKLAEYIDITTSVDQHGVLSVLTADGVPLLEGSRTYQIQHTSAPSVNNFINDLQTSAITVKPLLDDGTLGTLSVNLVSSGHPGTITTGLTAGSMKGLLDIRDTLLPRMVEQLDNLAYNIIEQVNAISNNGSSFPPQSELTGTTAISSNTVVGFSGSVMIAVIDQDGTPASSPYGDELNYRPLTLDLSRLSDGSGSNGEVTVQTIIDEINAYFGPVYSRASVGNLREIRLAAVSDSIADAGTAQFELELDNVSTEAATVVIDSITVIDPNDLASVYNAATLPSPNSYTINAGDRERTGIPFTVDFGGGNNIGTYTVRVQVSVTDQSGNVSVATIDYPVTDNVTGIRNDRYNATAVTAVSGDSAFYTAPSSQSYARARLVNANGVEVAAGQPGYLEIVTTFGQSYGVAISELDSQEIGLATSTDTPSNRGFSHFFGMNNLFNAATEVEGAAVTMAVRSDIASNSSLLQTGRLVRSNQPSDPDSAYYTYELGRGNNSVLLDYVSLSTQDVSFSSAGTLPGITTTLNGYMEDILGYASASAVNATHAQEAEQLGLDGLTALFQKSAGVNTDQELAAIVELENAYRASVQIISVIQKLFETLTNAF